MPGQRVILESPSMCQPRPTSPFVRVPEYWRLRAGSIPARPGGTSIGTVYTGVPWSDTLNWPASAPTGTVGDSGNGSSVLVPLLPSGTFSARVSFGVTHCPAALQVVSPEHVPQLGPF